MHPDFKNYNPDPAYLRTLVDKSGLSQRAIARRIGVSERMMRYWLAERSDGFNCPYTVQFCLEVLAAEATRSTP